MKEPPKPGRTAHQRKRVISHERPAAQWAGPLPAKKGVKPSATNLPFAKGTPPGFKPF